MRFADPEQYDIPDEELRALDPNDPNNFFSLFMSSAAVKKDHETTDVHWMSKYCSIPNTRLIRFKFRQIYHDLRVAGQDPDTARDSILGLMELGMGEYVHVHVYPPDWEIDKATVMAARRALEDGGGLMGLLTAALTKGGVPRLPGGMAAFKFDPDSGELVPVGEDEARAAGLLDKVEVQPTEVDEFLNQLRELVSESDDNPSPDQGDSPVTPE